MSKWIPKTWNGFPDDFYANGIWTDGTNIYYSDGSKHYVLDKSTSTWVEKTWNGLTDFYIDSIWTDGTNVYYSKEYEGKFEHYVLDKSTSTWVEKTWNGLTDFYTDSIWTDGTNIYYSRGSEQYVLDKSTSTWTPKTWNGLTDFYADGNSIWTDGTNIYYSGGGEQYVLDKSTSTWVEKTWNYSDIDLEYNFDPQNIWTDGTDIYYSYFNEQYVLNKSTSTWVEKTWNGLTDFFASSIWTDGTNIYHSGEADGEIKHCVLDKSPVIHDTKLPYATIDTFKTFHSKITNYIKNQNVLSSIETMPSMPGPSTTHVVMQYDGIINGVGTVTVNDTPVATDSAFSIPFNRGDDFSFLNVSAITVRYYKLRDYTGR